MDLIDVIGYLVVLMVLAFFCSTAAALVLYFTRC